MQTPSRFQSHPQDTPKIARTSSRFLRAARLCQHRRGACLGARVSSENGHAMGSLRARRSTGGSCLYQQGSIFGRFQSCGRRLWLQLIRLAIKLRAQTHVRPGRTCNATSTRAVRLSRRLVLRWRRYLPINQPMLMRPQRFRRWVFVIPTTTRTNSVSRRLFSGAEIATIST